MYISFHHHSDNQSGTFVSEKFRASLIGLMSADKEFELSVGFCSGTVFENRLEPVFIYLNC
jgi:hypothetical protein